MAPLSVTILSRGLVAVGVGVGVRVRLETFELGLGEDGSREWRFPEEVADEVVLADVIREEIYAGALSGGVGLGQSVEVRAAEHVAFADSAGRDGGGGDGGVEFRVRGRVEHFLQEAAGGGEALGAVG